MSDDDRAQDTSKDGPVSIPSADDAHLHTSGDEEGKRNPKERFFWGVEGEGDVRVIYDAVIGKGEKPPAEPSMTGPSVRDAVIDRHPNTLYRIVDDEVAEYLKDGERNRSKVPIESSLIVGRCILDHRRTGREAQRGDCTCAHFPVAPL